MPQVELAEKDKREKKQKKHKEKNRTKEPKLHQMVGYTNEANPFGDSNLHQQVQRLYMIAHKYGP